MANARVFRANLRAQINAALSPAERSRALAAFAREKLTEAITSGRAGESFRLFVDGRPGAREESVRGDGRGVILYEFSYTAEAAVFALAYLRRRAPAVSGLYRESFFVAVNGRMIRAAEFNPRRVPANASIIIGNTQPYNRLVDAQRAGKSARPFQGTPPDMYRDVARELARRFGNSLSAARIRDVSFPGKYRLRHAQHRKTGARAGAVLRAAGAYVESPGVGITPL